MKHFAAASILLLVCSLSQTVAGQEIGAWVNISPAGEQFTVQLPQNPPAKTQKNSFDQLKVDARVYTATSEGVQYTVWSLRNQSLAKTTFPDSYGYLDLFADLVWESLLKPLRDSVSKGPGITAQMSYQRELQTSEASGREYFLIVGGKPGVVDILSTGEQVYVLTVLNADARNADTLRFIKSFHLQSPKPSGAPIIYNPVLRVPIAGSPNSEQSPSPGVGTGKGGGMGAGEGDGEGVGVGRAQRGNIGDPRVDTDGGGAKGETNYNRTFTGREVSEKARILSKADPRYTESARKYLVSGTILMRATLSKSGAVTNIRIIKGLPHGLTQKAIEAAKEIKFVPASKDGHTVSQYVQLEYNFNVY